MADRRSPSAATGAAAAAAGRGRGAPVPAAGKPPSPVGLPVQPQPATSSQPAVRPGVMSFSAAASKAVKAPAAAAPATVSAPTTPVAPTAATPTNGTAPATTNASVRDQVLLVFANLVGKQVEVTQANGVVQTGTLHAFKLANNNNGFATVVLRKVSVKNSKDVVDSLVLQGDDIVQIHATGINLKSSSFGQPVTASSTSFKTDTAISNSGSNYERELVAWNDESVPAEGIDLDNMATDSQFDQFATNEKTFGFVSTYSDELYTTKIDKSDPTYNERAAQAAKLADSMQKGSNHRNRQDEGGFENEEAKYSSVRRSDQQQQNVKPLEQGKHGSYVPPHRSVRPPKPNQKVDDDFLAHTVDAQLQFINDAKEKGNDALRRQQLSERQKKTEDLKKFSEKSLKVRFPDSSSAQSSNEPSAVATDAANPEKASEPVVAASVDVAATATASTDAPASSTAPAAAVATVTPVKKLNPNAKAFVPSSARSTPPQQQQQPQQYNQQPQQMHRGSQEFETGTSPQRYQPAQPTFLGMAPMEQPQYFEQQPMYGAVPYGGQPQYRPQAYYMPPYYPQQQPVLLYNNMYMGAAPPDVYYPPQMPQVPMVMIPMPVPQGNPRSGVPRTASNSSTSAVAPTNPAPVTPTPNGAAE